MPIVTIFRSRLRAGVGDDYAVVAKRMSELAAAMDGFIDQRFYVADDGERVTVVRFRDRDAQRRWAEHPEHREAQRRGRDEFYDWFDLTVCEEITTRTFTADH